MESIFRYFCENLPNIEQDYQWKTSSHFTQKYKLGGNHYQKSNKLKFILSKQWKEAEENTQKMVLAEEIVKHWGGIRTNSESTIEKYVKWSQEHSENWDWPLMGVASYSKILAIKNPEKFAIYDARVSVAINAAQYVYGSRPGKVFNYVPSRNKKIVEFTADARFKRHTLSDHGWHTIPYKKNYTEYIDMLCQLRNKLRNTPVFKDIQIHDLEMSLFANAERLAKQAIKLADQRANKKRDELNRIS